LMSSVPCCSKPVLLLPEFKAKSIELFQSMAMLGTTEYPIQTASEAAEVIKVAKAFDIDASNYTVVVREATRHQAIKADPELQTLHKDNFKIESNYAAEGAESFVDVYQMDAGLRDVYKSPVKNDLNCQVCHSHHFNKLSLLLTHYTQSHFLKEAKETFKPYINDKNCKLCGRLCKTTQQLIIHIGVKHKKINALLTKNGYRQHIKVPSFTTKKEVDQTEDDPNHQYSEVSTENGTDSEVSFSSLEEKVTENGTDYANYLHEKVTENGTDYANYLHEEDPIQSNETESEDIPLQHAIMSDLKCQVCSTEQYTKLSLLLTHYIRSHFITEGKQAFEPFHTNKKCKLCGMICKTTQQLIAHIGVKHKKVNMLLVKNGYKQHVKVKRDANLKGDAEETTDDTGMHFSDISVETTEPGDIPSTSDTNETDEASKEKKSGYRCQICEKDVETLSLLWNHYSHSHFCKDIKEIYGNQMDLDELLCKICDKKMKSKAGLLMHIGTRHHKVNEILVRRGLAPLDIKLKASDEKSKSEITSIIPDETVSFM